MKLRATLKLSLVIAILTIVLCADGIVGFEAESKFDNQRTGFGIIFRNLSLVLGVSRKPTFAPQTVSPTFSATDEPTPAPTRGTKEPTPVPTKRTDEPTPEPTAEETEVAPSHPPSKELIPTISPTKSPTRPPTEPPTRPPTSAPTKDATTPPSRLPTRPPTSPPTGKPTRPPTMSPTIPPTRSPTIPPTKVVTRLPSNAPSEETNSPTRKKTFRTRMPSSSPSDPAQPSEAPTESPSTKPSGITASPSVSPSLTPSLLTSGVPSPVPSEDTSVASVDGSTAASQRPSSPQNSGETPMATAINALSSMDDIPSDTNAPTPKEANLVAEVQEMASTIEFVVTLSLWSPEGIPRAEEDFEPISDAVLTSIRMLYCVDPFIPPCVVKDDLLLATKDTFVSQNKQEVARQKTLVVPSVEKVVAVEEDRFAYTSWDISVEVLQLGTQYVEEMIVQLQGNGNDLSSKEILILIPKFIEEKVTQDVEKSIREGTFDGLLHSLLAKDTIVSSIPGEEEATFGVLIPQPVEQETVDTNDDKTVGDLTLIAIYVAIAVVLVMFAACMLMLYYYRNLQSDPLSQEEPSEKQKDSTSVGDDEIDSVPTVPPRDSINPAPPMPSPSIATESEAEDLSTAVASWQVRPRRFVLQSDSQADHPDNDGTDHPDDGTDFPTAGSVVAGSVVVGSMMAESVESSLDGWSVTATDINWA